MRRTKVKIITTCIIFLIALVAVFTKVNADDGYSLKFNTNEQGICNITVTFDKDIDVDWANENNFDVENSKEIHMELLVKNAVYGGKYKINMADKTITELTLNPPSKIELDCDSVELIIGVYSNLSVKDSSILTIDEKGNLKPLKEGKTTVTAKIDHDEVTWEVEVIEPKREVIEFEDENLYNAVVEQLGNKVEPSGKNKILIKEKDLKGVTELKLAGKNISNISGIEKFTNLMQLDLSDNNISNIDKLAGLKELIVLYVGTNQISDISAVKNLDNLIYLSVGHNNLDSNDINAIREMVTSGKLPQLSGIWLFDLNINNFEEIDFLLRYKDKLDTLDLHGNNLTDISFLKEFTKIGSLYLFDNNIVDAKIVKEMQNIRRYNIVNQHVELTVASLQIDTPTTIKQAFELFGATQVETVNCKLSDDKTKVIIEDKTKEATIKVLDGDCMYTTVTIKYDTTVADKPHPQTGSSSTIFVVIAATATTAIMCVILNKKNKSIRIK